jgi:23S rRNA (guanine2445-N2)-methyltransferase / 23S rRNA (guanine2069-N7)-methyltransferase
MTVEQLNFFATCPRGMEDLLAKELANLAISDTQVTVGAVYFCGPLQAAYGLCLWSRVANRVLLQLNDPRSSPPISTELALYTAVSQVPWEEHMTGDTTFAVDFNGTNKAITNTQFGAVRVKDAIVDRMRTKVGRRPDVDRQQPQLRIQARLAKDQVQLGLDLSGISLHQRGYRLDQGVAPLKENLAAGILLRVGWPELAKSGAVLVDPMCGSGTLLIEAALIAKNVAPGLIRIDAGGDHWGFEHWLQHRPDLWQVLVEDARAVQSTQNELRFWGADESAKVLQFAKANAARAGVENLMGFSQSSLTQLTRPELFSSRTGLLVCNPPYGERLGDIDALKQTYLELAESSKKHFAGWQLAVFTGNPDLAREMRLRPKRTNKFFNGAIPCELSLYELLSVEQATLRRDRDQVNAEDLSEGALMVANRLRKNLRKLMPWLKNANTNAYRVYDADLPEYAAAVDLYNGQVHVQEYAAPKTIAEDAAERRLRELLSAVAHVFAVSPTRIALKTRQRNKGKQQYEKIQDSQDFFVVEEGEARYWINLRDYLDTGLFLDHRPLRRMIFTEARAQRFLNLFCYTASASVQAVLGGATQTVSVDMSNTYLEWAQRNFELNNIRSSRHELVQADCLKWLDQCRQGFDLILLDPPTFSNSKRMDGVLDIQRDHVALVRRCMELLNPAGKLYFSTNLRNFKYDFETLSEYAVEDISARTLDEDFARNPKIHHCFRIQHKRDQAL